MRGATMTAAGLAALALCACDRQATDHLKQAGEQAKGAVVEVGKAAQASAPAVKAAGEDVGEDLREVGSKAAPVVREAGRDLRNAADKAGDEIREAGQDVKERVRAEDAKQ